MEPKQLRVAFICDCGYVLPTVVAIHSLILNKDINTDCFIYLIETDLDEQSIKLFEKFRNENVHIQIIHASVDSLKNLHKFDENSHCVATVAALLKFYLPTLLPECEKILYLDGDILVLKDLSNLYSYDFSEDGDLACAVIDSGSIYYKHRYVQQVAHYFNSGVMLLNLEKMRREQIPEALIKKKQKMNDSSLMDQNVFNLVFDGKVHLLPITYNVLLVNLLRARDKYHINELNETYGSDFSSLGEIIEEAYIVHFSSKDKPWKYEDVPWADEWYRYYQGSPVGTQPLNRGSLVSEHLQAEQAGKYGASRLGGYQPKVSIVMPVYNVESYLEESLESVLRQSFRDIEVICVNDGSTDQSKKILESAAKQDPRVIVINQTNQGQSVARNVGIRTAVGNYIYFMDSDDKLAPHAIQRMYEAAEKSELDVLLFDGISFFENPTLEQEFPQYKTYYQRKYKYRKTSLGADLYVSMVKNGDYKVSPCLQFFNRDFLIRNRIFYEKEIIHEDNLFSFISILQAQRVAHISDTLFYRRVHDMSTMTSEVGFKNFQGYYVCAISMMHFLNTHPMKNTVVAAASQQIQSYLKTARSIYVQLSPEDKTHACGFTPLQKLYFDVLIKDAVNQASYQLQNRAVGEDVFQELQFYKREVEGIKKSATYKIGRFVTFIPRKVRGAIRCYREHGLKYTLHCVFFGEP